MDGKLKVLWLCNLMPGFVAASLGRTGTNKEGWIEGIAERLLKNENIELAIAFPIRQDAFRESRNGIRLYGFVEDADHPENYDKTVEAALGVICEEFMPDVIHIFGTEFPHALSCLKLTEWRQRTVIHLQGIVEECGKHYRDGVPKAVCEHATFRDVIRRDSIWQQEEKYRKRAALEREVLKLAVNVCGRTEFDKRYATSVNPNVKYYTLNETLRPSFYQYTWSIEGCNPHQLFLSQGNYPLKGAHYAIEAVGKVRKKYPDVRLHVAGDRITAYETFKDRLKISSYGRYLRELVSEWGLEKAVSFTGSLNTNEMIEEYLAAQVYIMTSSVENSPNSLGEAMLLGMPCITSRVGGIPSLAEEDEVRMYESGDTDALAQLIIETFENQEESVGLGQRARAHALLTHDGLANYKMLMWMYEDIAGGV